MSEAAFEDGADSHPSSYSTTTTREDFKIISWDLWFYINKTMPFNTIVLKMLLLRKNIFPGELLLAQHKRLLEMALFVIVSGSCDVFVYCFVKRFWSSFRWKQKWLIVTSIAQFICELLFCNFSLRKYLRFIFFLN